MLSILIPVYNEDVTRLVNDLVQQGRGLIEFEVLCFDDGSAFHFHKINQPLDELPEVLYKQMPENLGRSKIRNVLADAAKGDYLLFMDCDSKVVHKNYLKTYVDQLDVNTLLYGGRCYDTKPPADAALRLHWSYGIQREQQSAVQRQQHPYHAFMTNNFLIPKSLFQEIRFDESLKQYGHEDTLFGMELRKRQVKIRHLDNPLEHIGLERGTVFLEKTKKAIENLHQLNLADKKVETKLTKAFDLIQRFGLTTVFVKGFKMTKSKLYNKILTGQASVKWFDLYKLGLLAEMSDC